MLTGREFCCRVPLRIRTNSRPPPEYVLKNQLSCKLGQIKALTGNLYYCVISKIKFLKLKTPSFPLYNNNKKNKVADAIPVAYIEAVSSDPTYSTKQAKVGPNAFQGKGKY